MLDLEQCCAGQQLEADWMQDMSSMNGNLPNLKLCTTDLEACVSVASRLASVLLDSWPGNWERCCSFLWLQLL
jgi:hypothetical protein